MGRQSKYENGIYRQLQELMERMDSVEKEHKQEVKGFKEEISRLKKEIKFYVRKTSCYVIITPV